MIVQNTNNGQCVSEDFGGFIGTDNGWKVVLESNHISQLSHCLLPLCVWEKAGKHTHTHAAQQSAEEMKKIAQTQITAKHYHAFFRGQAVTLICIILMMSNDSIITTL